MLIYFYKGSTAVELEFKRSPVGKGKCDVTLDSYLLHAEAEVKMIALGHVVTK